MYKRQADPNAVDLVVLRDGEQVRFDDVKLNTREIDGQISPVSVSYTHLAEYRILPPTSAYLLV